jgi:hypothetical protein
MEDSGPIPGTDEACENVDAALRQGFRGLPGGNLLARLIGERRGVRNQATTPPLTKEQILGWADAYHARTGHWPRLHSGPIPEAPGETWAAVEAALSLGSRGLPGGSSLYRFLRCHRQIPGPRSSRNAGGRPWR